MPRIASYVRLRGSESNTLEEKDIGYYEDAMVRTGKQEGDDSDRQDAFSAEQNYLKSVHEQQQKQLEDVNVSKGVMYDRSLSQRNYNGFHDISSPPHGTIDCIKVDFKVDVREGRSGELKRVVSFREPANAPKLGVSRSGKWQGANGETQLERTMSGRWRPFGDDLFRRTTGSPLGPSGGGGAEDSAPAAAAASGGQWAASIQRVASYREVLQQKLQQEQQEQLGCSGHGPNECPQADHLPAAICTMHSACNELRTGSQRFSRQQTARLTDKDRENSSPARRARFGDEEKEKSSPPRRFQRQQTARYSEWDRKPAGKGTEPRVLPPPPAVSAMVPRSSSQKIVHSQRSFSMRETPTSRAEAETASDQAPRRKSSATPVKPRVSFSDANSTRPEGAEENADAQRIHEKWKDSPSAMRQARFLSATTQPLRYNYEQPGFVERRSTDGCGRSYSNGGGFRAYDKDQEKENARQPPLSRTFSTFSFADKAAYRRMARTFTFSTTKHVQPVVVECVTCGKGLGIIVQGLPAGETSSFCKACKPGLPGAVGGPGPIGTGEFYFPDKSTSRSSSVKSYSKKKKGMLDYCRKLFGMSRRYHNK
ncbi:hypothetical protein Mapa_004727 [Marchantia paleacea]|nr:hypothetical protein Mapa_004727 [Marchantia paleacea]